MRQAGPGALAGAQPPVPTIPAQPVSPVVQVFTDPELTSFSFSLDCKHAQPVVRTADDYRELIILELAVAAANARLHEAKVSGQAAKTELAKYQRVLAREVGEDVQLAKLLVDYFYTCAAAPSRL